MRNDPDNELVKKKVKFNLMVIFTKVWKTTKLNTIVVAIHLVTLNIFQIGLVHSSVLQVIRYRSP